MTRKFLILPVLLHALALGGCEAGYEADDAAAPPEEPSDARDAAGAGAPAAEPDEARTPAADSDEAPPPAAASADTGNAPDAGTSSGKPTAPITIDYDVIGTPVVGQPVSINLNVRSSAGDRPVTLNYRINDASSLAFPEAQARRVSLGTLTGAQPSSQQVTVVPQREGRAYLNVSAEVETADGVLLKSIAIPIQVGTTPGGSEPDGDVVRDADGNPVISLPADDR